MGLYILSKAKKNWAGLLVIPYCIAHTALYKPSLCNRILYFFKIKSVRCAHQAFAIIDPSKCMKVCNWIIARFLVSSFLKLLAITGSSLTGISQVVTLGVNLLPWLRRHFE